MCPGEEEFRKAVAQRLGYDPFFANANKTVVVQISRSTEGFRSTVQIIANGTLRGEKQLVARGDDCGPVVSSLALAVSLALDDMEDAPSPPTPEPEKPKVVDEPIPVTESPRQPTVPKEPRTQDESAKVLPPAARIELRVGASPEISVGTAPAPTFGIRGFVAAGWKRLALRVDPRIEVFGGKQFGTGSVVRTQWTSVDGSICYWHALFACLGGGVGYLLSETEGIARPKQDSTPFGFLALRTGVEIPIGGTFIVLPELMVGANLTPLRVVVNQISVHQQSEVFGSLGISLGARLF